MYRAARMLTFNYVFNYIETYVLKNLWYHECFLRRFTHFLDIIITALAVIRLILEPEKFHR